MSSPKRFFVLLSAVLFPLNVALASGLQHLGFERGLLNWKINSRADAVVATGTEGEADSGTYADLGIVVEPYIGSKMLRLSGPKQINENQNSGANTVTHQLASTRENLTLSFRLFSWEHRGDDTFRFDVRDVTGKSFSLSSPLTITFPRSPSQTCNATPCEFVIDVGKRGDFLDSGWTKVKVAGLPTDGSTITVEYSVIGSQNEAHATWAYFDNANTPPVAKFNFTDEIIEGDFVTFNDESYDPDPGDKIVSWKWNIDGPGLDNTVDIEDQNPSFLFPDEGTYAVSLTVTDSFGASTTITTGGVTLDQVLIPTISSVQNWAPVVSVLNQEVLAGSEINLIGRFIEPGFLDTHTAEWTVDGTVFDGTVNEQNVPFVATGVATGLGTAPTTLGILAGNSLQITDNLGAYSGADFVLNILDADYSDPREDDNDSIATAPVLESGWVHLTALEELGDIDIFEIKLSTPTGPELLPAGSEVLVKLTNLPLDADLILLSKIPDSLDSTSWGRFSWGRFSWGRFSWGRFSWGRFPYSDASWGRFPYVDASWGRFPSYGTMSWGRFPYSPTSWGRFPWSDTTWVDSSASSPVESFPLSEMAFLLSSDSGNIGNGDIDLSELGLDSAEYDGMAVVGYSANRGLKDEELWIRTDFPGTQIYAVVVANNGMASSEPFSVQVEASTPAPLEALVGGACDGVPVVSGADVTTQTKSLYTPGGSIKTLIVTQTERMSLLNNMDAAAKTEFTNSLKELAANPAVMGEVISLPSNIYDGWDANHCSIDSVNDVAASIRAVLADRLNEAQYAGVEYILFVGGDNIVPHRRVPDETVISNERLYVPESFLEPGSSLYTSAWKGYNLTDDYFTDSNPEPFQGRKLYVPDIATARLIETPDEIMSLIQSFIDSDGVLPTNSALVSGYDFFADGSNLTKAYLGKLESANDGSPAIITDMVNETWTAADLRCNFLGQGAGCETHDVNSINAHFNHFAGLSAFGFNTNTYDDIISSADVANAGNGIPVLQNTLSYTIGCHAGLNVPDGSAYSADLFGGEFDPNLDFPQAMAQQKAVFIASTGYGLGDDEGIAGTELLMAIFSEKLLAGGEIGALLASAKRQLVNDASSMDVYIEKSSIQTTLYGLPMWKVAPSAAQMNPPVSPYNSTPVTSFSLTVDDGGVITTTHDIDRVDVDPLPGSNNIRSFYTASGDSQVTAWRPIQPKVVVDVSDTVDPVHGVLVTGGDYSYLGDMGSFYPVISKPRQEWAREDDENPACVNAFWPSTLASINTFDGANEFAQSLIILPGQFRCTSGDVADIFGIQRIFNSLDVQILRSVSGFEDDFIQPIISEIDFRNNDDGSLMVNVDAVDDNGISKIVLLLVKDGLITSSIYDNLVVDAGSYSLDIPDFISDTRVIIQVVDLAGNVSTWSGKGVNVRIIEVDAGDSLLYSSQTPTTLKGTIPAFNDLLTESPSMFYRWAFGDGTYAFGRLAKDGLPEDIVTVERDGSAWFTIDHQYAIDYNTTAELKVTDAFGGVGVDDLSMVFCGDAADLPGFDPSLDYTGCDVGNTSPTAISIFLTVDGLISDTVQYRLHLDIKTSNKDHTPDGKEDIMLKYHGGSSTGLKSLHVVKFGPHTLRFDFDLADVKWKGNYFDWYAETQDGVAGAPNAGFIDIMPDTGMFRYVMQ